MNKVLIGTLIWILTLEVIGCGSDDSHDSQPANENSVSEGDDEALSEETSIEETITEAILEYEEVENEVDVNAEEASGLSLGYIADHLVAKESVLRAIPTKYINLARQTLHVAYQHTSHGTHVSRGMFGLQDYKSGDDVLFAITSNGTAVDGKLDFHDYALAGYHAPGEDAADLSRNETAFIQATRNFLDDPRNSDVNVIMWSWCNIAGHNVAQNYLPGITTLISEYGINGTKIGTGPGLRQNPVTFILMTGHANTGNNVGDGKPKNQADLILKYCRDNNQFCLDYHGIDTHDMSDNYWEDTGDDGNSSAYGGNFYRDWQDDNILGQNWFEAKSSPAGSSQYGSHNSQHITANRKAYAMWWILAKIAGWR